MLLSVGSLRLVARGMGVARALCLVFFKEGMENTRAGGKIAGGGNVE